jgi:hypothetical protein
MEIPKKVKVGRVVYSVFRTPVIDSVSHLRGYIRYHWNQILIATHKGGAPRAQEAMAEAFWHEVTHAILYDMQDPLHTNEKFVKAFSERLNQVVHSAKF